MGDSLRDDGLANYPGNANKASLVDSLSESAIGPQVKIPRALPTSSSLKDYFSVDEEPRVAYTDAECLDIARLLRENRKAAWAAIPRIYIILRTIRQLSVIEDFLDAGIDDFWLPMSEKTLRTVLPSTFHSQFLETQCMILTKGFQLERGIGAQRHASFDRNEALPFRVLDKLGAGGYGIVHKIESISSGELYARKAFRRVTKDDGHKFVNELQIMKKINHLHCVRIVRLPLPLPL